jgi:hypothetical protein
MSMWTEFDGKIRHCPYWTLAAREELMAFYQRQISALARNEAVDARAGKPRFVHEHVVPKNVLVRMIRSISPATEAAVREVFDRFLFGVVVTRNEDQKLRDMKLDRSMPADFDDEGSEGFLDPWARYRKCGIRVVPHPPGWGRPVSTCLRPRT